MLATNSPTDPNAPVAPIIFGRPHHARAVAIILTIALHLFLLWLGLFRTTVKEKSEQRIHYFHLQAIEETPTNKYLVPFIDAPIIQNEKLQVESLPVLQMIEAPFESQIFQTLSQQELLATSEEFKQRNDNASAIGKNVFHPGLRATLNEEANKPKLARVEDAGPETYLDASGATVLVLGGGNCLRSPRATKIGEPQNWYMTPCAGKSESENFMERVEQSFNQKLKFDE